VESWLSRSRTIGQDKREFGAAAALRPDRRRFIRIGGKSGGHLFCPAIGLGSVKSPKRPTDSIPKRPTNIKPTKLRIISGDLRGRGVIYIGDRSIRPMKESLRESLFNIIGPAIRGRYVWDLFAGTGILAIESLSRGAAGAIAFERDRRFAIAIRKNMAALGISTEVMEVIAGDTLKIAAGRMEEMSLDDPTTPWIVYFCPPYVMWLQMTSFLFPLIQAAAYFAPAGSILVVEADKFFDMSTLPLGPWDVRPKGNMSLAFLETVDEHSSGRGESGSLTDEDLIEGPRRFAFGDAAEIDEAESDGSGADDFGDEAFDAFDGEASLGSDEDGPYDSSS
jgi:16S rRNA (guanine966-N2)-methyltransferase